MGKPSLYVVVRASYKEYEADLARVRGIAREQGEAISNALNNSISPKQAIKGFESLSVSLQKAIGAANAFNVKPQIKGLDELAKIAGVSAERMDYFTQAMVKTARENSLERSLQSLQKQTGMSQLAMAKFRYELGDFSGALKTVGSIAMSAAIPIAAFGTAAFLMGKSCLDAQLALQRLNVAYQSIFEGGAGAQLDFIYQQTQKIGLEFQSTAEAAKGFFAAGRDSTLAPQLNEIFASVTNASSALQLSGEQVNRTFLALGQMISKGKVQAEELRGQLGEQLPGAFQLAAKAMGMTTAELDKFMADGKLTAEDLLPKLADALNDKYAKAAEEAGNKSQAAINRMSTEWSLFKANVLNSEAVVEMLNKVTGALESWNSANKNAEKRARIEKQMRDDGVQGSVPMHVVDSDGNITGVDYIYSNEQIKYYDALNQAYEAHQANIAQKNRESERKLADSSSTIAAALKDTSYQKRIDLVNQNKKDNEAFITKRTAYEADGAFPDITARQKALKDLDAQQSAVNAKYQKDLEAIDNKGAKSAIAAAKAENGYAAAVAETTAQIAGYQQQLSFDKAESLGRAKAKIEAEYQQAVAKTTLEIQNQIVAKKITAAEGDSLMQLKMQSLELKKQVDMREAEERAREKEIQMVGDQLNFYKELGELSGQYGDQLDMQVKLIELQASKYEDVLKIPKELVEQWKKYKLLQESYDPFDGAYRGLVKFTAEYSNEAKQWESITYSWATDFNSSTKEMWGDFLDDGRLSFDKLSMSFTTLLKNMSYQALVQPVVLSIVGGVQGAVYGGTSAVSVSGGGASDLTGQAAGLAQQYGMSQIMGGSGLFAGLTSSVNGFGASMLPSLFAPSGAIASANATVAGAHSALGLAAPAGLGGSATLMGTLGAAGMGFGLGSLGGNLLAGLVGGNSANMGIGGGIGGGLGAGIGSIFAPGIGTWIGGGLGSLLGSGIGSMFGSWDDAPGLTAGAVVDLSKKHDAQQMEDIYKLRKHPWSWYTHSAGDGYLIQTRHRDGMPKSAAEQATAYLEQIAQAGLTLSGQVATSVGAISADLTAAYNEQLSKDSVIGIGRDWEGETPDIEGLGKELIAGMQSKISSAIRNMDISSLATAADGALADTTEEMMTAITKAVNFLNVGESLGDFSGEFTQAVSDKVLTMLNSMDTTTMGLDIDKSSLAGWGVASQAVTAWNEVDAALESILRPTSELDAALGTAKTQFDGWLDSLKALGWQQEALAEIEKERLIYMQQYSSALTRSAEQDLYLRGLALSAGTDSLSYSQQALKYKQENELKEYAKKYGSEADLLAAKAAQLNKDEYKGKTDWDNNAVYEAIKAEGMTVVEWLERYGRSEGFQQDISLSNQLMYTQQAEGIQSQITYWEAQYNTALQAQESAASKTTKTMNRLTNSFESLVDSLDEYRRSLWASDDNLVGSRYDSALANFDVAYMAGMSGDADALGNLSGLASTLLELGQSSLGSKYDYDALFYSVNDKLQTAQGYAKAQSEGINKQNSAIDIYNAALTSTISSTSATQVYSLNDIASRISTLNASLTASLASLAGTTMTQQEALMQAKADALNAGKTLAPGQTAGGWTAQGVSDAIAAAGMTKDQWWEDHGSKENIPGAAYNIYGSKYATESALLVAKATSMNAGKGLAEGQTAGGWTEAKVRSAISAEGMTVSDWYAKFGKAEGFATGGITPANSPFWVGERGPELMMSPQQYGVLSNPDSMRLTNAYAPTGPIVDVSAIVRELRSLREDVNEIRLYTKDIDKVQNRSIRIQEEYRQEGMPVVVMAP